MTAHDGLPRLPLELLEEVVWQLAIPCTYGDPVAARTLASCSLVSRTMRRWALRARYGVVVCPRHVREFRRWTKRVQGEMTGYASALFVALDDVSKLTSMSAGWDVELLRLLQQQGPHLAHLSLWTSETRALLRDPAQIKGPRMRMALKSKDSQTHDTGENVESSATIHAMMTANAKQRRHILRLLKRLQRQGRLVQDDDDAAALAASVPLKTDFAKRENNEAQMQAEMAAAKERARQTLPRWLREELADAASAKTTKARREISRRYKAHLATDAREYQHEHHAAQEAREKMTHEDRAAAIDALTAAQQKSWEEMRKYDEEGLGRLSAEPSEEDEDEYERVDWVCMPFKISICPSLPLHEHEEPLNFARMSIWTRLEELDVFVAVPAEAPRCLMLFASLVASPLVKFRFSSIYASLLVSLSPSAARNQSKRFAQPSINLAAGLGRALQSETLRSILFHEFNNRPVDDVQKVEKALERMIATCQTDEFADAGQDTQGDLLIDRKGNLASTLGTDIRSDSSVRVRILQGNQAHFGKLKDRRQDFLARALSSGEDCWTKNGM